ncbi:MAG: TIGR00153 family protein [Magnetococcales bacterium]|nr:TIGR00153 family protein [Magnetococcales bacterium]
MGRSTPLSSLFGKSPFKPLQQHMRQVVECANEIPNILTALNAGDSDKISEIKSRIDDLEGDADTTKDQLRAHLPKSLFMPVDRRDLLELLSLQDKIAGVSQDIASLIVDRKMDVPVGMGEPLVELSKSGATVCDKAAEIIETLDELVEMGFSGRESTRVLALVDELGKIEKENRIKASELTRSLFAQEDKLSPVSVMLWYQIINWLGDLSESAEKVGDRLRLLLAR